MGSLKQNKILNFIRGRNKFDIKSTNSTFLLWPRNQTCFFSYKIKNLFCFKDLIPSELKFFVVYQFTCLGCNPHYIGETTRHFASRMKEQTHTDKNSHILTLPPISFLRNPIYPIDLLFVFNLKKLCTSRKSTLNSMFKFITLTLYLACNPPNQFNSSFLSFAIINVDFAL